MRKALSLLVAFCLLLSTFTGVFAPVPVIAHSAPSVHTDCPATSIGTTSATLHGGLDGLGGYTGSNVLHVYFDYRIVGAGSWSQTSTDVHKSSTGDFSATATGLAPNTLYEFRAVAHGHDGGSEATVEGSTCEFTTLNDVPSVHTDCPATNIGATSATLHGGLDGFGAFTGSNEMHVYFQYRIVGAGSWSSTSEQHQSSTGDFSATATGLDPNAQYEFQAVAHGHSGSHQHTVEGSTCQFTTLSDSPSVHTDCPATSIGADSATLHGGLDGLGGFTGSDEIHVYFQYRIVGESTWSETSHVHQSSTGDFNATVTGLDPNTLYEFRAVAHGHEHEGDEHDDHHHTVEGSTCQFTTLARAITVTAVADTKVYGAVDPIFAYNVSPPLEPGDVFTGALSHADHDAVAPYEDVGIYAITQGDLSAGSDYSITFVSRDFTVTPKPITVTAALSAKVYGAVDPVFAYYVDPALESGDAFTGALSHASHVATAPYENIGIYAITQGDLSAGSNYTITFVSADFTVATKPITVTAIANTKVYGNVDPTFAYNFAPSLEIGDTFAGALSHTSHLGSAPYENVGAYTITQGTLYAGPKYAITFVSASFSVTPRPITVTATAATKPFGFADPTFTYSVSEPGIAFTGKLGHVGHIGTAPYESAGLYAITQGTLSAGANYAITFVSRNLTVTPMTANVPPTIDLPDFSAWPGVTGWSRGAVPSFTTGLSPFPLQFTLGDDGGWVKWTIAVNGIIIVDPIGIGLITYDLPLSEGRNNVEITAVDEKGLSTTRSLVIYLDTRPPVISLSLPTSVSSPTLAIAGSAIDTGSGLASLSINGERVTTFLDGSFSEKIVLQKGANIIVVEAKDKEGNTASQTFTVKYAVASGSGPSSIYLVLTIGRAEMEVNGMPSPLSAAPFIKDGRTLLPIRALIEVLGGSVQWNASTRTATVLLGSRTVALTIGSTTALVNGTPITLDVAPEIKNGRTFLPLRAVAENLGLDLAWEPISRTISLTYWP